MLDISSIQELLHKTSEIQWNITGTLPEKLKKKKKKIVFFYPITQKNLKICYFWGYFGGLETNVEFNAFYNFVNFWKFKSLSFG